jgi:hypothetical protein
MRFNEFKSIELKYLKESKGIFGRNAGDKFVHHDGREYSIVQVVAFPDAQQGQFETPEERDQAIKQFEQEHGAKIEWVNKPRKDMLGFGIAQLDDNDGGHVFWGKYLQNIGFDLMGSWGNGQVPPGWSLATKGAQKLQAGYDPQNLIKTEQVFRGAESIINTVSKNAPDTVKGVFTEVLKNLAQGRKDIVFPEMYEQQAAIRDYFGEIMQPIALMGGVISGDAEEARQKLADGAEWRDCQVMWPMSMNAALCDSFMIAPNGQEIGISSKGGQGAAASAKNLYDAVKKAETEGNSELLDSVKYTADVVRIIATVDQRNGPIELGKLLKVTDIDDQLNEEIEKYIREGKADLNNISPKAQKVIAPFAVKLETKGFNAGYALLSAASKTVAKIVNANPQFSKGAIALLNQSSIIQVYTNIGKKGNDAVLKDFRAVYPPNFQGVVKLEGGKNYYSSRIGGKMAFKID